MIKKFAERMLDVYEGTADELITAGIIRPDQIPGSPGRGATSATFWQGRYMQHRGPRAKQDETYLNVRKFVGRLQVRVGITAAEAAARREAELAEQRAANAARIAEEQAKKADLAKRNLASMYRSADDFRASIIDSLRRMMDFSLGMDGKPMSCHGYTLDADSILDVKISFDAIAEALIRAKVHFDATRHADIERGYRAEIAKHDPDFQSKLATLLTSETGGVE